MTEIINANKVSIVLPVYNVEKYLARCLDSILNQTFENFEVICVNDGSPDNSLEILEKYKKIDNRIKIISQENKGLSGARNTGIKHSNGEYIAFIDSDDVIHPQYLEVLASFIGDSDVIASAHIENISEVPKISKINTNKVKVSFYNNIRSEYINKKLYKKTLSVVWNKLYKKDIFENLNFKEGISPGEDDIFTFEMMMKINSLKIVDSKLYYYMTNPSSIMRADDDNKIKKIKLSASTYAAVINNYINKHDTELSVKEIKKLNQKMQSILFKAYLKKEQSSENVKSAIKELNNFDFFNYKNLKPAEKFKYLLKKRI